MNFKVELYILICFMFLASFYKMLNKLYNLILKQVEYEMDKQIFYEN